MSQGFGHIGDLQRPEPYLFSRVGPQDNTMSEAHPIRHAARLHGCTISLSEPVTSRAYLGIYLDNVLVTTMVVFEGDAWAETEFNNRYEAYYGSRLSVKWTSGPPTGGCTIIVDIG